MEIPALKLAKKKFNLKKNLSGVFSLPVAPTRQFHRLLIVCGIVFVGIVGFHVYIFRAIESRDIFGDGTASATPAPKVDAKKLEAVLKRYADKEAVRATVPTLVPPVSDPGK